MTMQHEGIRLRLKHDFPGFSLDAELALPRRGVTAFFGPSGSGKTTLLRCVAGLERCREGFLEINGEVWQDDSRGIFLPTHRRPIGYVFQEASLFPHLNVRRNLAFGMSRDAKQESAIQIEGVTRLLGIDHLLERMPLGLSGGERQRVAIARALLTNPRLLLMDEPLSALDLGRRQEILPYLERLHDELEIPVLYVSHQPEEVARFADYLVLLERGSVVAHGALQTMLTRLDLHGELADDAGVVIEARVGEHDEAYHLTRLEFDGGSILVSRREQASGHRLRFRVHARDVSLSLDPESPSSILNRLPAVVREMADSDDPAQVMVRLDVGNTPLLARITRRSRDTLGLAQGMRVWAQVKSVALLG
jgi:molybdate transport system ATP-binding protein